MHTIVVGAGALGTILAAYLARAGERVTLVARGNRAEMLNTHGAVVTGLDNFQVPVSVARSARETSDPDLFILATKTYDTAAALEGITYAQAPIAFSVQNGVQKNSDLAAVFGRVQTLGAAANMSGELRDDQAAFTLHDSLLIGEPDGKESERLVAITGMLSRAGIKARHVANISSVEWTKYATYSALMAPAVLCRAPTWKFACDPDAARVVAELVKEIGILAQREGVVLNDDGPLPIATICRIPLADAIELVRQFGESFKTKAPNHRISALQDCERGRRLEVEATLGFASRRATEFGMELPVVETCYRLCAMLDRQAR